MKVRVAASRSRATSASTSAQTWRSARVGRVLLDLVEAELHALPVLERELLELAQQPLLAVADRRDERLRGAGVELDAEPLGLLLDPARQLARLEHGLRARCRRRPP